MSTTRTSPAVTPPYKTAPAPWTLKGDMFWLILTLKAPLPAEIYDPLTTVRLDQQSNDFQGGIGTIQIIRYDNSPVGPYDELMILPGNFTVPGGDAKGKSKLRIARIYVDSKGSCYNGRRNWNIAKHLARFEWSTSKSGERSVTVFPPDRAGSSSKTPFFSATLTPVSWLPAVPMSTRYLPLDTTLVQPPIPACEEDYLPGTDSWKISRLVASTKRAIVVWMKLNAVGVQDEYWPQVKPWSLGVFLEKGELTIEKPLEFHI
ncbi:hypothetical protein DOTSEDRAFT_134901 [Dothistroma septosporum NZE10]|uniref:Uncharacterized protein n=1 Tax=Dothistroma septosporum (strain NZE10 / CBS 128990) TaxID=675120 RepID=N1PFP7_DOTSN|nr:hypothetical protein DOTSEDRAFT_134901 [Dothistroma septosporum NZE10]